MAASVESEAGFKTTRAALHDAGLEVAVRLGGLLEHESRVFGSVVITRLRAACARITRDQARCARTICVVAAGVVRLHQGEAHAGQLLALDHPGNLEIERGAVYLITLREACMVRNQDPGPIRSPLAQLVHALCDFAWRHANELDERATQFFAQQLCETIANAAGSNAGPSRITLADLQRYALSRIDDPGLSPRSVAHALGVGLRTLHTRFARGGATFGEWLCEQRLLRCDAELRSPSNAHRSIADIALASGFEDASHFGRLYKERFGVTPRARQRLALQATAPAPGFTTIRRISPALRRRRIQGLLELLLKARRGEVSITALPSHLAPQSLTEAYDAASALLALLDEQVIGYRVGASSPALLAALHLVEPYVARLAASSRRDSGAIISLSSTVHCCVQPHFAFQVSRTLRDGARSREELCSALAELRPALEVLRSPFVDPIGVGGLAVIAANGMHGGLVVGEPADRWNDRSLPNILVQSRLNGASHSNGLGADVFGDPIGMLLWLANDRARAGTPLQAGQLVLAGAIGPAIEVRAGDSVNADFVGLGGVAVQFSGVETARRNEHQ